MDQRRNVSVIIPTYNCYEYISNAVDSVLDQTFKDYEIIVIDDGSTDNTRKLIESYAKKWPDRVKYLYQSNSGVSNARNVGIKTAVGEYIGFLDSDDVWLEQYLEKMVDKIENGYDWVVCDNFKEIIDVGVGNVERFIERRDIDDGEDGIELLRHFLIADRIGSPSKVMVRREVLQKRNIFFDSKLRSREDWDFFLQLLMYRCKLGLVREPLYIYRIRNDNSNATRRMGSNSLKYRLRIFEKHRGVFFKADMNSILGDHYFALARDFLVEKRDITRMIWCMARNIQYKGLNDIVELYRRKK